MLAHLLYSFVTLFVIIDPVGSAAIFAGLMRGAPGRLRRLCALRGVLIATLLILAFALGGSALLRALGITLPAFRIAGGILLFLLATEMVFARESGIRRPTAPEEEEAGQRHDISVFPLAFPLLAGPGALTSIVLLMDRAEAPLAALGVIAALVTVMAITLALLLVAPQVMRLAGVTGANVVSRVLGIILAALAAQLVLDGLAEVWPALRV
ncbi:MAG: MarC family protein [Stellaceae bacterium]